MIIGFGSTEKAFEERLESELAELVKTEFQKEDRQYFDDSFIAMIKNHVDVLAKESQEQGKKYKTADTYPARYSYYWASVVADVTHIVFILSIHHINRRHGLSPDGWACLMNKIVFYVDYWDVRKSRAV